MDTEGNSVSDVVSATIDENPPDNGFLMIILIDSIGVGAAVVITTLMLVKKRKPSLEK